MSPKFSVIPAPAEVRNGITLGAIKSWKQLPAEGVVLVLGEQGEGKSALAWWIAEGIRKRTLPGIAKKGRPRKIVAYKVPPEAVALFPKGLKVRIARSVNDLKLQKGCVIIYDETAKNANARRSMSTDNVDIMELNALCRQYGHLLIYIAQHSKQPDADIVINSKWILHKHPSLLHIRFTRPELRPESELALELFGKIKERDWKKHVVVIDYKHGQSGVLRNGLASFWNEKLSIMYATGPVGVARGKQPNKRK